ncbi:ATP-binding cassette domain-containing protein [Maridesulfovibrio sp.]|uniref:ABC transporter ATP-binding protein n=1 Tax=Maridesulfovibrio sp. TaxID=2795000 RepID=UPI002A18E240|nr:ATP-binding cassette domain-containing protein [Maridesulfovibrio sp.]
MPTSSKTTKDGEQPVLEFREVGFHWPGGKGFDNVSFAVPAGGFALITGPSGAGKSTLLRLAVRLEEACTGSILLEGTQLKSIYPPLMRSRIGLVQQTPTLLPGTIRENLLMPFNLRIRKGKPKPDDPEMTEWLERLGLGEIGLQTNVAGLSVGQRQRLCLIRSALTHPAVLCFDEPTSALDSKSRELVEKTAEHLSEEGIAVLMVNHTNYRPACEHMLLTVDNGRVEVA